MVIVPEDVAKEFARTAKRFNIDKTEIVKSYKKIFKEDYLSSMAEPDRHRYALMILQGMLHDKMKSSRYFEFHVIDMTSVQKVKKANSKFLVGNMYLMCRPKDPRNGNEEEWRFGEVTMWRDQTGLLNSTERGNWYEAAFNGSMKDGRWKLNTDESTELKPIKAIKGAIPISTLIESIYPQIPLAEFDNNLCNGGHENGDYKMCIGTVLSQRRCLDKDRDYGVMNIGDDTYGVIDTDDTMNMNMEKYEKPFHGDLKRETTKSWLVTISHRDYWLPKSQVTKNSDGTWNIPIWLVKKKNIGVWSGITAWSSGEQAIYKPGSIVMVIGLWNKNNNDDRSIDVKCIHPLVVTGLDNVPSTSYWNEATTNNEATTTNNQRVIEEKLESDTQITDIPGEMWLPFEFYGYDTSSISNYGRIKCDEKIIKNTKIHVHNEVYEHFIDKIPDGHIVKHRDGDKSNNHFDNLSVVIYKKEGSKKKEPSKKQPDTCIILKSGSIIKCEVCDNLSEIINNVKCPRCKFCNSSKVVWFGIKRLQSFEVTKKESVIESDEDNLVDNLVDNIVLVEKADILSKKKHGWRRILLSLLDDELSKVQLKKRVYERENLELTTQGIGSILEKLKEKGFVNRRDRVPSDGNWPGGPSRSVFFLTPIGRKLSLSLQSLINSIKRL